MTISANDAPAGVIPGEWHVRYQYPVGQVAGHFFDGLRQKRILATRCSASGHAYLPPRAYCERSFERCDSWVEAGHEGVIEAATIVPAAFENLPPPPYAIAYVRLDGVCTALLNFVRGVDLSDVRRVAKLLSCYRWECAFEWYSAMNPSGGLPIFTTNAWAEVL